MNKTISAEDLNIQLKHNDDAALFKWLLASFLMGKRIQAEIAAEAYRVIADKHGRDTPRKLAACSHRELVAMLGRRITCVTTRPLPYGCTPWHAG